MNYDPRRFNVSLHGSAQNFVKSLQSEFSYPKIKRYFMNKCFKEQPHIVSVLQMLEGYAMKTIKSCLKCFPVKNKHSEKKSTGSKH